MELHGEDLHVEMGVGFEELVAVGDGKNPSGFEGIKVAEVMGGCGGGGGEGEGGGGREIWLDSRAVAVDEQTDDMLDVTDPSLFYSDFPPLPDLPCMSSCSSSSSSSNLAAAQPISGSSSSTSGSSSASSAASWAVLRTDVEVEDMGGSINHHQQHHHHHPPDHNYDQQEVPYHEYHDQYHDYQKTMDATPSSVALSSTDQGMDDGDCMDVMESFGCIDLFDNNEIWDPTPLFEGGGGDDGSHQGCFDAVGFLQQDQDQSQIHSPLLDQGVDHNHQQQQMVLQENALADQGRRFTTIDDDDDDDDDDDGSCRESPISEKSSEDIGMVFLEWLKSNKESISAEDLRSIRIKKSTIECAERRLGGGQEGMTRLLKLVLQWVQNHHLQNRRMRSEIATTNNIPNCQTEQSPPNPDPSSLNPNLINPCFSSPRWPPLPPYITDPAAMTPLPQLPSFPQMVGYMGGGADPNYANGANSLSSCPLQPADHRMLETSPSWPPPAPPHFGMPPPYYNPLPESSVPLVAPQLHAFTGYGNQYGNYPFSAACQGQGDGLMRLGASATKEARKKRMARQRRFFSHHHRTQNHQNGNPAANQMMEMVVDDVCVGGAAQANHNWMYNWQPAAAAGAASPSAQGQIPNIDVPVAQGNSSQKQALVEKQQQQQQQQAWKTEKNLRFLLQKVLKQSDVGNLGRIVLPKKEAETHLPELEARDGITIPMEDIGTSRVWHMRYRFWPNNKSRMYLLENTGEFVRSNGLQEGDFIVIYSDVKCGKYMIRGVKVRPQQGPTSEPKKLAKTHKSRGN